MCGFAGFLHSTAQYPAQILQHMGKTLYHRGPDDGGTWQETKYGLGFAFRRLAIQDLSPQGHQPMHSASGRYVMVFNGEIYNFRRLQKILSAQGCQFRGHSDTEVILAAVETWGLVTTLKKLAGMFAIALWDKHTEQLYLARDRLGEKPLYYGFAGKTLLFGSELKALQAHPAWQGQINRDALGLLMQYAYIPCPHSIYQNIYKLTPGTYLSIDAKTHSPQNLQTQTYWSMHTCLQQAQTQPFAGDEQQAQQHLKALLMQSIEQQLIADVPVGAFLSGGIDSSSVVALMQQLSTRPVKTFSIGFHESGFNEAHYAKQVAQHLGTEHTELYVTAQQAMDVVPLLPSLYDEPFADSSQIPTYLVSQLAKQQVSVSLSGDGGDELFGGYNRYLFAERIWHAIGWCPPALRNTMAKLLSTIPAPVWNQCSRVLPKKYRFANFSHKVSKLLEILRLTKQTDVYQHLVSLWSNPQQLVLGSQPIPSFAESVAQKIATIPYVQQLMFIDSNTYLPDDILVKVDRAAMGVSLETRIPMLDYPIVEFALSLPLSMKIQQGTSKKILRNILYEYVPRDLIERPKMGFGVPIDHWLRGPLKSWADQLLDANCLAQQGYLNPSLVQEKWQAHLSGKSNYQYLLWPILMFQAWLTQQQSTQTNIKHEATHIIS
jgi:asparagine synthase (glutamine-hydrolysing)